MARIKAVESIVSPRSIGSLQAARPGLVCFPNVFLFLRRSGPRIRQTRKRPAGQCDGGVFVPVLERRRPFHGAFVERKVSYSVEKHFRKTPAARFLGSTVSAALFAPALRELAF